MRLNIDVDCPRGSTLGEGDPQPPEDRASFPKGNWIDRLYRSHRDKLVRFAMRHTQPDRAPDVVQQLFALAARGQENPLEVDAPGAYLQQATINLIRSEAKYDRRRCASLHVCSDNVPIADVDAVAASEARDMLVRLEAIMAELAPCTREIFLAHRFDGFTYTEIAVRTGLSVKTVEKHMSRAIGHVTRRLDP
ncbi:RNA polymerase sigma-70 factor (ECF subfamily) [Novosphingobium sp. PhB165]|uniref:RNA polymerase sigma factor n=1 Tax=Novosphingobium sp. PhB165 TaxID=2485105 RepID=UPI00104445A3|nr:RNA polymerase sigma factor [Novosphingobium sp. PhB165]TCM14620.1 RNA polymerase sigma-70 factor (ECF subfamily) [Novosphingobium sp. PhB165]